MNLSIFCLIQFKPPPRRAPLRIRNTKRNTAALGTGVVLPNNLVQQQPKDREREDKTQQLYSVNRRNFRYHRPARIISIKCVVRSFGLFSCCCRCCCCQDKSECGVVDGTSTRAQIKHNDDVPRERERMNAFGVIERNGNGTSEEGEGSHLVLVG